MMTMMLMMIINVVVMDMCMHIHGGFEKYVWVVEEINENKVLN